MPHSQFETGSILLSTIIPFPPATIIKRFIYIWASACPSVHWCDVRFWIIDCTSPNFRPVSCGNLRVGCWLIRDEPSLNGKIIIPDRSVPGFPISHYILLNRKMNVRPMPIGGIIAAFSLATCGSCPTCLPCKIYASSNDYSFPLT